MEGILNDSSAHVLLHELVNGSSAFENHYEGKSHLARILFSYDAVNKAIIPVLFLVGAIGNGLSVSVFCMAPSHRHLSSSYYLSALAISDTGFLINLLAVWLEDMGYRVITQGLMCPLVMYLGQVTCFLSVWLTVSFTVERFFAVCYPLTRPTVCTVARAKKVISVLTLVALLAFSYVWLIARVLDYPLPAGNPAADDSQEWLPAAHDVGSSESNNSSEASSGSPPCTEINPGEEGPADILVTGFLSCTNNSGGSSVNGSNSELVEMLTLCSVRPEHIYISSIASHIDSIMTLIFPFFIITYLNVRIAICVWKLKDQRQNIVACAKIATSSSAMHQQQHNQQKQQQLANNQSSACRVPGGRRSSPLFNGSSLPNNCKRINIGSSTTSLNIPMGRGGKAQSSNTSSAAEARVTKTLLLVSTSFLVLNLPAHAIRAVAYIQSLWGLEMVEELQAAQQWANILFNMNFSVNFLLYCVSGRNFRKSLWSILFNGKKASARAIGRNSKGTIKTPPNCSSHGISQNQNHHHHQQQQHRFTVHHNHHHHQVEKENNKINLDD